ncbi:V-type ATP synthase subunit C [Methanocaldococcus villosus KIN24-T80]|uniref:A-type ATP synthase subunit C n=1 Tax=Methanocaldococcus villosus KIN24-T80 TaxID=1069083 RepID=N6VY96_9EURY|nr:V-type ATP synthase subunit C [Methanocaldococcus villosus]ENN96082.1 V-type ATP synthase subunit C [Methanocaldococcus villosus KIN24-T80]
MEFLTILLMAAIVIIVLTVIVWITKMVIDLAPYAYVNARVRSREARLLDRNKINEILEAQSFDELIGILEDTDYSEYISKVSGKDPIFIEKAFDLYLANLYKFLYDIAPNKAKQVLKIFMKKFDIKNIKTLIRAKNINLDAEEISDLLLPFGNIPKEKLRELSEVKTVEEVIRGLEGTEYFKVLQEALTEYEHTKNIIYLELALDKYYLNSLKRVMMIEGKEEDTFREFIGRMIDIENLKVILKTKADGLSGEEVVKYLTSGYELAEWKLKDLANATNIEAVLGGLEGTKYAEILSECMDEYNREKSIYVFEKILDKYLLELGKKLSLRKPFGIGPIIGLIVSKELEIKNLKAIIKGKMENMKAEEIKNFLIYL